MDTLRPGDRFFIPLGDDENETTNINPPSYPSFSTAAVLQDVLERAPTTAKPPLAPTIKTTAFPPHKKRTPLSAFKQRRPRHDATAADSLEPAPPPNAGGVASIADMTFDAADRRRIDHENRQKIAAMSDADIERERKELFENLDPALIQRLLQRSTLDEMPPQQATATARTAETEPKKAPKESKVRFAEPDPDHPRASKPASPPQHPKPPPSPPQAIDPDPDPSDLAFLSHLHTKYFPNLPHDPSKLAWMQPSDASDTASPYHPSHLSLPATALRFNFRGELLPPRLARQIPVSAGLHHHGDAPEAAGYTIPELARLARSTYAPQRCVAFQTLGRVLFRLGDGGFGHEDDADDEVAALSRGLWDAVEGCGVVACLAEAANATGGHLSARSYAQEALWNWQRGGGRRRKAV